MSSDLKIYLPDLMPRFVSSEFGAQEVTLFQVHSPTVGIFLVRAALSIPKSALFAKRPTMVPLIQYLEASCFFRTTLILFPTLFSIYSKVLLIFNILNFFID
jgi:hypothetical protein